MQRDIEQNTYISREEISMVVYRYTCMHLSLVTIFRAMFFRVLARVSVHYRIVSQQKGKKVSNSLQRLLVSNNIESEKHSVCYSTEVKVKPVEVMPSNEKKPFRRLPTDVRPYHYDISLTPNFATFLFDGTENVHIDVSLFAKNHQSMIMS